MPRTAPAAAVGEEASLPHVLVPESLGREIGHAWWTALPAPLAAWASNTHDPHRSRLVLWEDETALGPSNASHAQIRQRGEGAYSHWQGGLFFSTSDNSDPRANGRSYRLAPAADTGADDLAREVTPLPSPVLDGQLRRVRELTILLRSGRPDLFEPGSPGVGRPTFGRDDPLDLAAAYLAKELSLLEQTVLALVDGDTRPQAWTRSFLREVSGESARYEIDLTGAEGVVNVALELANTGREPIVNPRLVVNGKRDWFDLESIRAELLRGDPAPGQLAERIWRFLVENRYHSQPASVGAECHDPVKLLHVYGYGFCDDAANAYARLARTVGLEARVWGLDGHVVPEVRYDGAWHMFDPDHEVFYLDAGGTQVASVEQLAADPALLAAPRGRAGREPHPFGVDLLKQVFASQADNRIASYAPVESMHDMGFTLRPGERVVWRWSHVGHRLTDGYDELPRVLGNGDWIYEFELEQDDPLPREVAFELPYPILDGGVAVHAAQAGAWSLELRTTENSFQPVAGIAADGEEQVFALGGWLRNGTGEPDDALVLRLSRADPGGSQELPVRVIVKLAFQLAPRALPALEPGVNDVAWGSGTALGRAHVTHRIRER